MGKNILIINAGSTSLKYGLFDSKLKKIKNGVYTDITNFEKIIRDLLRQIGDVNELIGVGHRVVHGGGIFNDSIEINDSNIANLESLNNLAPLHNPHNIKAIKILRDFIPGLRQVAVFDTSFFSGLPDKAALYAIPEELADEHKIRRYGFHGISHEYCLEKTAEKLEKDKRKLNIISCHLGGGWSAVAIKKGQAIDTSMGYTPIEGLVMMTRTGDVGAGVVLELLRDSFGADWDIDRISNILNKESGIKALSGGIEDYRELLEEIRKGNQKAKLAFDLAIYRLVKYIGAYWFALEGAVDAIVLTGAIGAGDKITRDEIKNKLKFLGKTELVIIEPDEELAIAEKTKELIIE